MPERMENLQAFTAALSAAVTMKDVARVLFEDGLEQFGVSAVGIVWRTGPRQLELVFAHGLSDAEFRTLDAAAAAGQQLPIRDAILSRKPVWLDSPEEIRARYPVLEPLRVQRAEYGCAVVPLVIGDRCPGVIGFTFKGERPLGAAARGFIEIIAQLAAHAFERARLYDEGQQARRAAEQARLLQERLMAVVGHELKTPLGSILMTTGALLGRADVTPEQRPILQRIERSANRISSLVRELVDLGRAQQGIGIALELEEVDLGEVAANALLEFEAPDRALPVSLRLHGSITLRADRSRAAQVVTNLVGNALRHGAGSPVEVEVRGDAQGVTLSVHNLGPAIPPEAVPQLFEPFRKGSTADHRGEGLGLYIVDQIARAHRGRVDVRSDEASGTTFIVHFPRS